MSSLPAVSLPCVFFGGSRSLPRLGVSLSRSVAAAVAARGLAASVGCAPGADCAFVSAFVAAGAASRLSVFAVGGASGAGFPVAGVSLPVLRAARASGAAVVWWAGGRSSVALRRRLPARSAASLAFAASGPRSCAFFVVSSPRSAGSFRSLRLAAAAGLPCFVLPVGFPPSALPLLAPGGRWVRASFLGFRCFRWFRP